MDKRSRPSSAREEHVDEVPVDLQVFAGIGGMKWPLVENWVQNDSVQAAREHEMQAKAR